VCKKYRGNVKNYMNSVAIVETPADVRRLHYMVTLISNVLYKNSAVDHQTLATRIHRIMEAAHPPKPTPPGELPEELTFGRNLIGYTEKQEQRMQTAQVQAGLAKLGYKVGTVDGKYGPKTAGAIRAFQKDHQLPADGLVTEELLRELLKVSGGKKSDDWMSTEGVTAK
jgi:hypothetical protein